MKAYRFKSLLLLLIGFISFNAQAQLSPDWVWAGHDSLDIEPKSMAADASGNIFTVDILALRKRSPAGVLLWEKILTNTTQVVRATGIATDPLGNIYLSGYFVGTALIGTVALYSRGYHDIFVAKVDPNGNVLWARSAGGTGNPAAMPGEIDDASFALAVDAAGNSYIAGKIHTLGTTVHFDSVSIPPFSGSGFGAKYDTNGKIKWVWMLGGPEATKIALGTQGSVYYSWGPSLSKFNADGSVAWYKTNSGTGRLQIKDIETDNTGNCFITGDFSNSITLGSTTLTANGGISGSNMFLAKYDANGNVVSAIQSTGGYTTAQGLALDSQGNPHVTGSTNGNVSFGPNFMLSTGNEDVLVLKFNALNGAPVWAQTGGSTGIDAGLFIKVLPNDDCLVAGTFHRAATFGNFTVQPSQPANTQNGFLAKLSMIPLSAPKAVSGQNLHLYPNPAKAEVTIVASKLANFRLQAFNLTGQQVFEGDFSEEARLKVQNWPAGIYLLKFTGNTGTISRKLIVTH